MIGRLTSTAQACAVAAGLAALVACSRDPALPTGPIEACEAVSWDATPQRRNVVLIVNDTMRRDRVGVYGGPARTPAFDAFAGEGFYLTRVVSQAPWTKPSIATLFTGLYPSHHGVITHPVLDDADTGQRHEADVLGERLVTLAEVLQAAGYATGAFVANPWVQERFGFAQGFDEYVEAVRPAVPGGDVGAFRGVVDPAFARVAPGETISRDAAAWIAHRDGARPYFLYLHYMDSHGPYPALEPDDFERDAERIADDRRPLPKPARQALEGWWRLRRPELASRPALGSPAEPMRLAHLELAYEKGIERFDEALAALLASLAAHPAAADTAVLITSDHGESFFERGWGEHGYGLFGEELRVPFAARMPGVSVHGAVDCPAGLIDVMATLCTYLGVECPPSDFGVSLLRPPPPAPERARRYIVSEGVIGRPPNRAIQNAHYKLLWEPDGRPRALEPAPPSALYQISADPHEEHDLLADGPDAGHARLAFDVLRTRLDDTVVSIPAPAPPKAPIDDDTRARLEALGYLKGDTDSAPGE